MKLRKLWFAAALVVGAPAIASASPWNIQPDGSITANPNALSYLYVSRSAGFTHSFGLFDLTQVLVGSYIFVAPPSVPGDVAAPGNPGGTFLFGLYVSETNLFWFTDNTQVPVDASQVIKFKFTNLNDYTTRIEMEDLKNHVGSATECYHEVGGAFNENCDYNDMVVDVTNTPEPATMGLLAIGLVGLAGAGAVRRRGSFSPKA